MNTQEKEEALTLEILETIEKQDDVTQRHLADRMGVALGLANSYLKRCVRKGLIKIHQAPANRYLYYLTPKGFAEKSRLTAQYLTASFDFYRRAGESIKEIYNRCEEKDQHRILFCGVSELAEIASLKAHEHNITIVGTFDPTSQLKEFLSLPVWKQPPAADEYDVCIFTALTNTTQLYELLCEQIDSNKVLVPAILGINVSQKQFPSPLAGEG